jgi:hypothetical protein
MVHARTIAVERCGRMIPGAVGVIKNVVKPLLNIRSEVRERIRYSPSDVAISVKYAWIIPAVRQLIFDSGDDLLRANRH